jgi:hypothetical protein
VTFVHEQRPLDAAPVHRRPPGPGPVGVAAAAGNAAVARLMRAGGRPVVQRHASWEHAMMGDAKPRELAAAVGRVSSAGRQHVLTQELSRVRFFKDNPAAVPDTGPGGLFEGLHVLRLAGSGLHVTYGEVNALADYLPNGTEINRMTDRELRPILQFMRQEIADACGKALGAGEVDGGQKRTGGDWTGAERPGLTEWGGGVLSRPLGTMLTEDAATRGRGFQSYTGLVSRNACHFAPLSWERFAQNHTRAVASAARAYAVRSQGGDPAADETQAWVHNGYADHFLEDSFAAGHLVNKTLIMQWFMEYAYARDPVRTKEVAMVRAMGTDAQPHVAGQDLYELRDRAEDVHRGRAAALRPPATLPTDPQTASELRSGGATPADRAALAGVRPVPGMTERQVTHQYQRFLDSGFLQSAAGEVHDHFNALLAGGVLVENGVGERFRVGGDDTQLLLSDAAGARAVMDAVNLSRADVAQVLQTGATATAGPDILMRVPAKVVLGDRVVSLREWNETAVREYCRQIFPPVYESVKAKLARFDGSLPEQSDPDLAATR